MKIVAVFGLVLFLNACGSSGPGEGSFDPLQQRGDGTIPVKLGVPGGGPYLYGTTYLDPVVSVYSEASNEFVEQLQPGCSQATLNSAKLSPDESKLYVAQWGNGNAGCANQITVLDTATNQFAAALSVPRRYTRFYDLTTNHSGAALYAYFLKNDSQYDILGFFNTASRSLTATLQMPSYYLDTAAVRPTNGFLYAAGYRYGSQPNTSTAYVDVVDPVIRKIVKSVSLGGTTSEAAGDGFDSSGGHLYVHYNNAYLKKYNPNEIRILNPSTGAQEGVINLPDALYGVTGTHPDMLISAKNRLYINNGNTLYVYDLGTRSKAAAIPIPTTVSDSGMAFDASQSTIYLSSKQYVYVISTATDTITGKFLTAPNNPQYTQIWLAAQ